MKNKLVSYTQMALAMTLAGSSVVAGKLIINSLPIFLASCLSLVVALIVLVPLVLYFEKGMPKISFRDIRILFLQALTGTFLFRVFVFLGLKYTSAADSGIITSTEPAVTGLLAFIFLKEKLYLNKIAGILFAVAGIMIINTAKSTSPGGLLPILGNSLVFLAVVGESLFTILTKVTGSSVSPLLRTTIISFFGFMCFLPFSIGEAISIDFSSITYEAWLLIVYYGVVVTVIAFLLWFRGARNVPAGTAGIFSGFIPVGAILLSALVLREKIHPGHILSLIFVLIGIVLITIPQRYNIKNLILFLSRDKTGINGLNH